MLLDKNTYVVALGSLVSLVDKAHTCVFHHTPMHQKVRTKGDIYTSGGASKCGGGHQSVRAAAEQLIILLVNALQQQQPQPEL